MLRERELFQIAHLDTDDHRVTYEEGKAEWFSFERGGGQSLKDRGNSMKEGYEKK